MKNFSTISLALFVCFIFASCGGNQTDKQIDSSNNSESNFVSHDNQIQEENCSNNLEETLLGEWECVEYTNADGTFDSFNDDNRISFHLKKGGNGFAYIDGFKYAISTWLVSQNGKKLRITIDGEDDTFQITELTTNQMKLKEELEDETIYYVFKRMK
ncbi:MAG: lipocalin family protein [Bacteroidales bacterium]|nr:lipocalin family protein [Bacteroidales bacterium]